MKRLLVIAVFFSLLNPSAVFALVPNDTFYPSQWHLPQISAESAWDITTGSSTVVVAVIDAGIDLDHPDLAENIWINNGEIPNNGIDDDQNGFIDDINGWDFVDDNNSPVPEIIEGADLDAISHGTTIAGVIGAVGNNGKGLTGVSWDVRIMSIRTLDEFGTGSSFDTVHSINYAVANGADVINLSFAGDVFDENLLAAVKNAFENGVVVVAALGNEGRDVDKTPSYPACFDSVEENDWVIGVTALDQNDQKTDFSNFGSTCADIAAPGAGIPGLLYYNETEGFSDPYNGLWSGTSLSAPIVSGAVALLLSEYPGLLPDQVRSILMLSVDPLSTSGNLVGKLGAGRLNITKALEIGINFVQEQSAHELSFIRGESLSGVYVLTEDGDRLAIIDANTYFTYEDSFDAVEIVPDVKLQDYPLSGLVLPRAGVVLVKIQSDPRVYALSENVDDQFAPKLREIVSEEVAINTFGVNWSDFVIDISPSFFTRFKKGSAISSPELINISIMKTRQVLSGLAK